MQISGLWLSKPSLFVVSIDLQVKMKANSNGIESHSGHPWPCKNSTPLHGQYKILSAESLMKTIFASHPEYRSADAASGKTVVHMKLDETCDSRLEQQIDENGDKVTFVRFGDSCTGKMETSTTRTAEMVVGVRILQDTEQGDIIATCAGKRRKFRSDRDSSHCIREKNSQYVIDQSEFTNITRFILYTKDQAEANCRVIFV